MSTSASLHFPLVNLTLRGLAFFVGALISLAPASALADGKKPGCRTFYKQKRYVDAAECFLNIARSISYSPDMKAPMRAKRGVALRNAALSLKKGTQTASNEEEANHLRMRAVRILTVYLKQRLYDTSNQRYHAYKMRRAIAKEIGFARLIVLSGENEAQVLIQGYKFKRKTHTSWTGVVLPGKFKVTIRYGSGQKKTRDVEVQPKRSLVVRFAPPVQHVSAAPTRRRKTQPPHVPNRSVKTHDPPPPKYSRTPSKRGFRPYQDEVVPEPGAPMNPSRVWGWTLLIAGGAAVVGGVIYFGMGASVKGQRDKIYNELQALSDQERQQQLSQSQEMVRLHQDADSKFGVGWLFVGIGALCGIASAVFFFVPNPATDPEMLGSKTPPSSPKHAQGKILLPTTLLP